MEGFPALAANASAAVEVQTPATAALVRGAAPRRNVQVPELKQALRIDICGAQGFVHLAFENLGGESVRVGYGMQVGARV